MTRTILVAFLLVGIGWPSAGETYVQTTDDTGTPQAWPTSPVLIDVLVGCLPSGSLYEWGPCWHDVANEAAAWWNAAGARFAFVTRTGAPQSISTCVSDGFNTITWASHICGVPFQEGVLAVTAPWSYPGGRMAEADILFNTTVLWNSYSGPLRFNAPGVPLHDFHRLALHEFGHVLGLAHPDDHGQVVSAIMNSRVAVDRLQADDIAGIRAIYGRTVAAAPKGSLENPGNRSFKSGIGVISGWVCNATRVEVAIGNTRIPVVYGTSRGDTASVCGDTNNGFVTLVNWNLLGDGVHTMRLVVDGVAIGLSEFKVTTFGQEFLQGAAGAYSLFDFPRRGSTAVIEWDQSSQNFVVVGTE